MKIVTRGLHVGNLPGVLFNKGVTAGLAQLTHWLLLIVVELN